MALDIRNVADDPDAAKAWMYAAGYGFLRPHRPSPESVRTRLKEQDLSRALGVFDGPRCVATYRSFPQELTVPGGAPLTANAVSAVTVTAPYRRQGLVRRFIERDLAEAKERGDAVATLVASEYRIYGRFGFGPATSYSTWRVTASRSGVTARTAAEAAGDGSVTLTDAAEIREIGPGLHDAYRRAQPGAISRDELWWRLYTGEVSFGGPYLEPYFAVYRDASGQPQGMASFTVEEKSEVGTQPTDVAKVSGFLSTTPQAERALWHLLISLDWMETVDSGSCPPDALLPDLLPDPRAARLTTRGDFLWLRPLDLPRMLAARTYAVPGRLVLDVTDPLGLAGGRVLLEADETGEARCVPTGQEPDLALTTGALSRLYLGEEPASRLAALGLVSEERAGALARADLMLRTARRPFCLDIF